MKYLIYDIEIVKAIPMKAEPRIPDIEYAEGWHDYANVGISVIGSYDYENDCYKAFLKPEFKAFEMLASKRKVVSFNGIMFDDMVCKAEGLNISTDYDILREVYKAVGLDPFPVKYTSVYRSYGLDDICKANGLGCKT